MDRAEFLRELEEALAGEVSPATAAENLRYYDAYIAEEAAKGRDEAAPGSSPGRSSTARAAAAVAAGQTSGRTAGRTSGTAAGRTQVATGSRTPIMRGAGRVPGAGMDTAFSST